MKMTRSWRIGGVLALLLLGAADLAGCGHELFVDQDFRSNQTLRYYDNDSATETTKDRRQSQGMPFGMPQGSAAQ